MKVRVFDKVYIPGYGMGPFYEPIQLKEISDLKLIQKISRNYHIVNEKFTIDELKNAVEESKKETKVNLVSEEKIIEEAKESDNSMIDDEVETENLSEEISRENIQESNKLTKEYLESLNISELKEILDDNDISYLYKDTKTVLIKKILDNNL